MAILNTPRAWCLVLVCVAVGLLVTTDVSVLGQPPYKVVREPNRQTTGVAGVDATQNVVVRSPPSEHLLEKYLSGEQCYYCKRNIKVNPFIFEYKIEPQRKCDPDVHMIVMVNSQASNVIKRAFVRETWGSVATGKLWPGQTLTQKVKLVFVMGEPSSDLQLKLIFQEQTTFGDILLGNFNDSYRNLTYKSLLAMKYVYERCPNTKYMIKSDDDVFVNLPGIMSAVETNKLQRGIFGYISSNQSSDRKGKWELTYQEFPFKKYPPYAWGAAYVISTDIVQDMFVASEYVPQFHVDDLYIAGVLAKVVGANLISSPKFSVHSGLNLTACSVLKHQILIKHDLSIDALLKIWRSLSTKQLCR